MQAQRGRFDFGKVFPFAVLLSGTLAFVLFIVLLTRYSFPLLEPYLDGTAARPYVYRVLTPFVINALTRVFSLEPHLAALLVMYAFFVAFAAPMWGLAKLYLPPTAARVTTLIAPLGIVPFMIEQRQIYDFPTLFFFRYATWRLRGGSLAGISLR